MITPNADRSKPLIARSVNGRMYCEVGRPYINGLIDLHAKRVSITLWTRIPDMLFVTLALLSVVALLLYGYWLGWSDRRHLFPTTLLVVAYATTFLLVIDLDRPQGGFFQVSQ